jgi:hypothetical protein
MSRGLGRRQRDILAVLYEYTRDGEPLPVMTLLGLPTQPPSESIGVTWVKAWMARPGSPRRAVAVANRRALNNLRDAGLADILHDPDYYQVTNRMYPHPVPLRLLNWTRITELGVQYFDQRPDLLALLPHPRPTVNDSREPRQV